MSKKTYGIIGLVVFIAAFLVGLYGILPYSVTAAGIYWKHRSIPDLRLGILCKMPCPQ
jgi:hypothetical protein